MSKLFDLDSPVMRFLNRLADLVWLNILTMLCCIPIITIGASLTGMHYVLLKMVRNEEGYITRAFFKSFKDNFKQATILWLIILLFVLIFVGDLLIFNYSGAAFPKPLKILLGAICLFVAMTVIYVFPVLSRFDNTILNTVKNGLLMSILNLPKTILMLIAYAVPVVIFLFVPRAFPIVFLLGLSGPAYVSAMLYNGTFKRFEPGDEDGTGTEETDGQAQKLSGEEDARSVIGEKRTENDK